MKTRLCPYCRERVKALATVCRYCRRDLPKLVRRRRRRPGFGWLSALTAGAVLVGGTAFLATEFLKERRNWLKR